MADLYKVDVAAVVKELSAKMTVPTMIVWGKQDMVRMAFYLLYAILLYILLLSPTSCLHCFFLPNDLLQFSTSISFSLQFIIPALDLYLFIFLHSDLSSVWSRFHWFSDKGLKGSQAGSLWPHGCG